MPKSPFSKGDWKEIILKSMTLGVDSKEAQEFVDRYRGENPFGGGPFAYPKRSSSGSKIVLDIRHVFDIEHTHMT